GEQQHAEGEGHGGDFAAIERRKGIDVAVEIAQSGNACGEGRRGVDNAQERAEQGRACRPPRWSEAFRVRRPDYFRHSRSAPAPAVARYRLRIIETLRTRGIAPKESRS